MKPRLSQEDAESCTFEMVYQYLWFRFQIEAKSHSFEPYRLAQRNRLYGAFHAFLKRNLFRIIYFEGRPYTCNLLSCFYQLTSSRKP